jgi:hypothetical protein
MAEAESWSRLSQEQNNTVMPPDVESTAHCRWGSISRDCNRLGLKGTGGHSQSRRSGGIAHKDPFEDFLDLMAIEDGE